MNAAEIARRLRGCITASGGVDCGDPQLLLDAADMLDMKLPCSVAIAPATIIGKGSGLSTVIVSLQQRVKFGVEVGEITDAAMRRIMSD